MNPLRLAAAVIWTSSLLAAQVWSISGIVETPSTADVQLTNVSPTVTNSNTLPAGTPIGSSISVSANATATGSHAYGSTDFSFPQPTSTAPLGFDIVSTTSTWIVSGPQGPPTTHARAQVDATFLLHLDSPGPQAGRLWLSANYNCDQAPYSQAILDIDVGADGTIDFHSVGASGSLLTDFVSELPLAIPVAGIDLRVRLTGLSSSGYWGFYNFTFAHLSFSARFFPNQSVVAPFAFPQSFVGLLFSHDANDLVTLSLTNPWPSLIAFGAQPMNFPVPGFPTLTQLVSIDAVAFANSVTLPMPALPHGSALYAQGLAVGPTGTLQCSHSIRAYWP